MLTKATEITEQHYPYSWGGGHQTIGQPSYGHESSGGGPIVLGFDCSGACSAVLNAGGFLNSPMDSGELASFGESGEGNILTICANSTHVFLVFGGPGGTTCFSTATHNPRGGAGWYTGSVESGFTLRHPPGL